MNFEAIFATLAVVIGAVLFAILLVYLIEPQSEKDRNSKATYLTPYDLEYKGVTCIGADWENDTFLLVYNRKSYIFKQKRRISQSADTDHIRCVINQFLEDAE